MTIIEPLQVCGFALLIVHFNVLNVLYTVNFLYSQSPVSILLGGIWCPYVGRREGWTVSHFSLVLFCLLGVLWPCFVSRCQICGSFSAVKHHPCTNHLARRLSGAESRTCPEHILIHRKSISFVVKQRHMQHVAENGSRGGGGEA